MVGHGLRRYLVSDFFRLQPLNELLGLQAEEIHLCGEASAVPIIKKLLEFTNDTIEVLLSSFATSQQRQGQRI